MRSTDERVEEVLERTRTRKAAARRRRQRVVAVGGGALSVIAVVAVGLGVSAVVGDSSGISFTVGQLGLMGSVFSESFALGYIVVGLLGIILGAALTVLLYRLGRAPRSDLDSGDEGRSV